MVLQRLVPLEHLSTIGDGAAKLLLLGVPEQMARQVGPLVETLPALRAVVGSGKRGRR